MRCGSGEVVVFHDEDLKRLAGRPGRVRALAWHELASVPLAGGERIPQLDEVLAALGPLLCNVELKAAPGWRARFADDGLGSQVAALLCRHRLEERALVSSFDPLLLARFRLVAPTVATGLLFAADQSAPLRGAWAAPLVRPLALHPEAALVDGVAMARWRRRGYAVHAWTVDDPAELRCLAALGVDALITNRPAAARAVLASV
jgi:glycerophosphoryl diester phosphodiesterase